MLPLHRFSSMKHACTLKLVCADATFAFWRWTAREIDNHRAPRNIDHAELCIDLVQLDFLLQNICVQKYRLKKFITGTVSPLPRKFSRTIYMRICFHCMDCCFVDGLNNEKQVSSQVITCLRKFLLWVPSQIRLMACWKILHLVCLISSVSMCGTYLEDTFYIFRRSCRISSMDPLNTPSSLESCDAISMVNHYCPVAAMEFGVMAWNPFWLRSIWHTGRTSTEVTFQLSRLRSLCSCWNWHESTAEKDEEHLWFCWGRRCLERVKTFTCDFAFHSKDKVSQSWCNEKNRKFEFCFARISSSVCACLITVACPHTAWKWSNCSPPLPQELVSRFTPSNLHFIKVTVYSALIHGRSCWNRQYVLSPNY